MLDMLAVRDEAHTSFNIQGPHGAVSFLVGQLPDDLAKHLPLQELNPWLPIMRSGDEVWLGIDLSVHHPDPEGGECDLVPGGRCTVSSRGLHTAALLQEWLAKHDKDEAFLQGALNEIYEKRFGSPA